MSYYNKFFVAPLRINSAIQDLDISKIAQKGQSKRLQIIIVGGSCGGLMAGILLKRQGHDVRILDSTPSSERAGTAAGIGLALDVARFFAKHDRVKDHPFAFPNNSLFVLDHNMETTTKIPMQHNTTSWESLYYRLRANFDSLASSYYPDPPPAAPEEGCGVYETGKKVLSVEEIDGKVDVMIQESTNLGAAYHQTADFVVAADGANSGIRRQLQPHLQRDEPGYVIWRGIVRCKELSEDLRSRLEGHMSLCRAKYNFVLTYTIPGENGSLEADDLYMNFVWYFWPPRSEISDILTDKSGHRHRTTLPVGTMRPEIWKRQLQEARKHLPAALVELAEKIPGPFVSVISDITAERAAFFGGKVFLIGDALAQIRPHQGTGTNKAAVDAILLAEVTAGRLSVEDWEERVLTVAEEFSVKATAFGSLYLCTPLGILWSQLRVRMLLYSQRFCKYWFGTAYPRTRRKQA